MTDRLNYFYASKICFTATTLFKFWKINSSIVLNFLSFPTYFIPLLWFAIRFLYQLIFILGVANLKL